MCIYALKERRRCGLKRVISLICAIVLCLSVLSEGVVCASASGNKTAVSSASTALDRLRAIVSNRKQEKEKAAVEETVPQEAQRQVFEEVPLYFQTDYPDVAYGQGSIATSGCSVTSVAMVASYLTGYSYMPDELANYFVGFDSDNHVEKLEHMSTELQLPWTRAANFHKAIAALKEGKIVIVLMNGKSIFTSGQHFIVLKGMNEAGKILVNDPNEDNYSLWNLKRAFQEGFTENDICCGYSGGWIYDPEAMPRNVKRLDTSRAESYCHTEVPLYYQTDYPNVRYGQGSIATSGCSVTSLAMVASYLTRHTYMPDELADFFSAYNSENHMEKLEYMSDQLQLPWEKAENFHEMLKALQQGKIVIALMEEGSPFTEGQHFIVLTGINAKGKIMVNDPNADNYEHWDLKKGFSSGFEDEEILKGYSGGWVYDPKAMPASPFIYVEDKVVVECRYPGVELTLEEQNLLAKMIWVEARGESFEGQQAIAEIVLNRLVSRDFQDSVKGVVYADNQFRSTKFLEDAEPSSIQYEALERALEGPYVLPIEVVHFATYPVNKNVWGTIGGHTFCYPHDYKS